MPGSTSTKAPNEVRLRTFPRIRVPGGYFSGKLSLLRWTETPALLVGDQELPLLEQPVPLKEQDAAAA